MCIERMAGDESQLPSDRRIGRHDRRCAERRLSCGGEEGVADGRGGLLRDAGVRRHLIRRGLELRGHIDRGHAGAHDRGGDGRCSCANDGETLRDALERRGSVTGVEL